jgi:uncharacterized membrane protein
MIAELAGGVFSHLCHQDPSRAWAPGGEPLALCARCTGVYAGAALAAVILPLAARFRPSAGVLWLHGAAMLQMLVLGFNPFAEPAWLRTLSGAVFAAGAAYFLWLPVRERLWPGAAGGPRAYFAAAAGALGLLQILVRLPSRPAGAAVECLALAGLALLVLLAAAGALALAVRPARRAQPA